MSDLPPSPKQVEDLTMEVEQEEKGESRGLRSQGEASLSLTSANNSKEKKRKSYAIFDAKTLLDMREDGSLEASLEEVAWTNLRSMYVALGGNLKGGKTATDELRSMLLDRVNDLKESDLPALMAPVAEAREEALPKKAKVQVSSAKGFSGDLEVAVHDLAQQFVFKVMFKGEEVKIQHDDRIYTWRVDSKTLMCGWTLSKVVCKLLKLPQDSHLDLLDWILLERVAKVDSAEAIAKMKAGPLEIVTDLESAKVDLLVMRQKVHPLSVSVLMQ